MSYIVQQVSDVDELRHDRALSKTIGNRENPTSAVRPTVIDKPARDLVARHALG